MPEDSIQILVIDDEPMIRQVFSAFLQKWGYVTFEAENGREGLDIFERENIDLVLTDLDMPVMAGLEVLAHLFAHSPETPVVIISGAGQLDDAVQSIKLGAWDYLTKPISNMAMLENTISRCLEKVRLVRENKMYQKHLEDEVAKKTDELRRKNIALQAEVLERKQREEEVRHINRHLETIVNASGQLFRFTTVRELLGGVLRSMNLLLKQEMGRVELEHQQGGGNSFIMLKDHDDTRMICGEGLFEGCDDTLPSATLPESLYGRLVQVLANGKSEYGQTDFFGHIQTPNQLGCIIYLDGCSVQSEADRRLVMIYMNNIASAVDSLALQEEIINTQKEVVITLGEVIESRSHETANHVRRVAEYTYLLAKKYGMSEQEAMLLRFASPMHDAGKIGIPDAVLNKPGKLTQEEVKVMHDHTNLGYDILKKSQRQILQMAAVVAHEHHERWDGGGYPQGLAEDDIHIYGRIVALADVFDALGSERCYKAAWPMNDVVSLVKRERGRHFDPRLVDILIEDLPEFLEIRKMFPDH
jgi:response regulator RpfG family c-di-GMP phosphodiesterase